jgi:phosphotriesterase-related protein
VRSNIVNTVLGPVPAEDLGVTSVHEELLYVLPGAQYAYDIEIDRPTVFDALASKLTAYKQAGGGTVVDVTGMFQGRDVHLLEALSRTTGVHIIASSGQGPEAMLGGYFLTPQTNPPTPWPAERFAEMFGAEVTEGMVVPRVERRGPAGIIATAATKSGMTATDESLFRGSARAALATGVPVSIRFGAVALDDLEVIIGEGLDPSRVVVGGLDRVGCGSVAAAVCERGAYVVLDHVGSVDALHLDDERRASLIAELVAAGHGDRILLSSDAIGYAVAIPARELAYDHLLTSFVPLLARHGVEAAQVDRILVDNPRELLTVRVGAPVLSN